jgi:hypothetical protein
MKGWKKRTGRRGGGGERNKRRIKNKRRKRRAVDGVGREGRLEGKKEG